MKKYFQKNIFISLYVLLSIIYHQLNWGTYKGILLELRSLLLFFSVLSIVYTFVLKDKFIKIFYGVNIVIIVTFIISFMLLKPTYTYKQARDIMETKKNLSGKIIDYYNNPNNRKIGLNVLKVKPKKNLLVQGDYLFYVESKDGILRYRFDSINGEFTEWK